MLTIDRTDPARQRLVATGVEIARDSALTGALPGRVLRSGVDTDTITVPACATD